MNDAVSVAVFVGLAVVWYGVLSRFVKPSVQQLVMGVVEKRLKTPDPFRPVACIFANGRDDDTPGLMALYYNQPVIVGNDLYPPDHEVIAEFDKLCVNWYGLEIWQFDKCIYKSQHEPRIRIDIPLTARAIKVKWARMEFGFRVNEDH